MLFAQWTTPSVEPKRYDARFFIAPAPQNQASPDANATGKASSQTQQSFNGKIVKSKDQLVLKDSTSNTTYKLDRQDLASQYENKDVKVTGTLDSSDNTIRVSTIEPTS